MITVWPCPLAYEEMCVRMQDHVRQMQMGHAPEAIWFLEHLPVYTYGIRTPAKEICALKALFPAGEPLVLATQRGGKMTFHGPGQRIVYMMMDLKKRQWSVKHYIKFCEQWIIYSLRAFSIKAFCNHLGIGIWTAEGKIASMGMRVQNGMTSHGFALNVSCDLSAFQWIMPCGLSKESMTSLQAMGISCSLQDVDEKLMAVFPMVSL